MLEAHIGEDHHAHQHRNLQGHRSDGSGYANGSAHGAQRQDSQKSAASERESLRGGGPPVVDLFSPHRKVGVYGLALLTFFNVSGGPWGSEPIVASAGPLPGFICLLFMAVFWGLPISLVTSEMSSALPHNGGYTLWVDTAFGAFWGFQESFWSWGSCVVDNALYPVLAYETFIAMYQGNVQDPLDSDALEAAHSWWIGYFSKLFLTVLFSLPVLIGRTEWVTKGMSIMIVLLTLPFAVMLPYIVWTHPMDWSQLAKSRPNLFTNPDVDWVALIHVTFWNFNGFDCASTCAGEVRDPGRAFPRGLLSALVIITLMTGLPLMVAVAANTPEWENWDVGWWSAIANQSAGPWFAWSVVFSSLIGTFGMHAAVMWEDAFQLCGMAEQGLAPKWLAGKNEHLGTPQNATILCMLVVMALIVFDFRAMVIIDNFFSVASGLLEIAAFAHLKRTRPDLPRPYSIPGINSDKTLLMFLFFPVSLGIFVLMTSFGDGWISILTLLPFIALGLALPTLFKSHISASNRVGPADRKSLRGVSFSRSESDALVPSIGGIYGALHLQNNGTGSQSLQSPMRPLQTQHVFDRTASRDSLGQIGGLESAYLPSEVATDFLETVNDDGKDHIFVDDSVQFGSIFTDPKLFRTEDDEFLSAVGRPADLDDLPEDEEVEFDIEDGDEDRRRLAYRSAQKRRTTREQFLAEEDGMFIGGTDEERSYDEASLD